MCLIPFFCGRGEEKCLMYKSWALLFMALRWLWLDGFCGFCMVFVVYRINMCLFRWNMSNKCNSRLL